MSKKLRILYEDAYLIAVEKPAGLLSIPDRYDAEKPNVLDTLRSRYDQVFTMHRLDRETSGILLFARDEETNRKVQAQFQERTILKEYLALVESHPQPTSGTISYGLGPHPFKKGSMIVIPRGKPSTTDYETIEVFRSASLVSCRLHTGRTHQIRVHLAEIGCPLLVDQMYGNRTEYFLSQMKGRKFRLGKDQEERPLLSRTPLHASKLGFRHPATGDWQEIECDVPKDMRAMLNQFRKWASVDQ